MSYTVETINGCTKKLVFNFETVDLSTQIESALKKKQSESNLKGFRKGKAPLNIVKQMYGPQLENEALRTFVSEKFFQAIDEEGIRAIGYPMFDNTKYEQAERTVSFEAIVEIMPEFEIKDYSAYEFEGESAAVETKEIDELRDRYLSSKAEVVEIKDEAQAVENGHMAVINFQGEKEDGERPENMGGKEYVLEVGSNTFIPGFEEGVIGMKKGEKKDLSLTFPEDYHMEELKNASVKFEVELLEIKEKKTPEFTDELAKEFGFESVEDFEAKSKVNMLAQKERQIKENLHQKILEKFIEDNEFDVPSTLLQQQKKSVQDELKQNLLQQGFNEDMVKEYYEKWDDDITGRAVFQVRSGLILDRLAKEFNVETNDSDFDAKLQEMAKSANMEKAQIEQYYRSNEQIKSNIMYAIREEKTFEEIKKKIKIK